MPINCTRCEATGFLNADQLPDGIGDRDADRILTWLLTDDGKATDVQVCDCCGDGDAWYGAPGEHYGPDDLPGRLGPYASNGGLCQCH